MNDRWKNDSVTALRGSIEKYNRGNEGDFIQSLIIADHATEKIMRNYLIFEKGLEPPFSYPDLLKETSNQAEVPQEVVDFIKTFRLIRDGFHHQSIKKIGKGLKGTTTGLTVEKSFLEAYLLEVCKLFNVLADIEIELGDEDDGTTD